MNKEDAQQILGLLKAEIGSVRSVRAAWARAMRDVHPDTVPLHPSESASAMLDVAAKMAKLTLARDTLLDAIAGANNSCNLCRGTGKVRGRLGATQCQNCNGTGEKFR